MSAVESAVAAAFWFLVLAFLVAAVLTRARVPGELVGGIVAVLTFVRVVTWINWLFSSTGDVFRQTPAALAPGRSPFEYLLLPVAGLLTFVSCLAIAAWFLLLLGPEDRNAVLSVVGDVALGLLRQLGNLAEGLLDTVLDSVRGRLAR